MRLTGGEVGHVAPMMGMLVAKVYRLSSEETFLARNMTLATRLEHLQSCDRCLRLWRDDEW